MVQQAAALMNAGKPLMLCDIKPTQESSMPCTYLAGALKNPEPLLLLILSFFVIAGHSLYVHATNAAHQSSTFGSCMLTACASSILDFFIPPYLGITPLPATAGSTSFPSAPPSSSI